jgi:pyruvate/2-oxoglutarate dehydrogenase complex dihydrolipoamide acyltransferase (E2) component
MQAPTLDKSQADRPINGPARSRRRLTSLLVAATLAVLGGAAGVTVALANRPEPAAPAAQPAATTVAPAAAATPTAGQPAKAAPAAPATAGQPVVLADGRHDAFVRKVDSGRGTIVLDVVQVFHDQAAVEAAVEDGKPRADAQYLQAYVRNQNPRLRTLPLASGVRVNLLGGCEEPKGDQQALAKLASNARLGNVYYYTVTVKGGAVRQLDEHLAVNAC